MSQITPEAGGEFRSERPYSRGLLTLRDSAARAPRRGPDHAVVWDTHDALTIPVRRGPVALTVRVLAPGRPGEPTALGVADTDADAEDGVGDPNLPDAERPDDIGPASAHATLNRHTLEPDFRGMLSCPTGVLAVGDADHVETLHIGAGRWHVTVGAEPRDLPEHVEVWLARGLNR